MNIQVRDVTFSYAPDVVALRQVSLEFASGQRVAIVGENGAGKTTLAKHLNGLLKPDSGQVLVGGWDTREHSPAQIARRVGYAFQNPDDQLFERTVERELAFGPKNLGLAAQEIERRIELALDLLDLGSVRDVHPYDLHASRRKQVTLAATIALLPPVMILDEPTTGQDAAGMRRLQGALEYLAKAGTTLVTISHDIDFCAEHFERCVLMADGRILADGATEEVLAQDELLAMAAVAPPQLFRLADELGLEARPRSPQAFVDAYSRHYSQQERGSHDRSTG